MQVMGNTVSPKYPILRKFELPHDKTSKMACVPSEDSDQPGHPPSLIRVFAVHSMGNKGPKLSSCEQQRLWLDWADAQADLSLRWAQSHFVGFVMRRLISCKSMSDMLLKVLCHL